MGYWKVMETLGGGALLKKVGSWGLSLEGYILSPAPLSPCLCASSSPSFPGHHEVSSFLCHSDLPHHRPSHLLTHLPHSPVPAACSSPYDLCTCYFLLLECPPPLVITYMHIFHIPASLTPFLGGIFLDPLDQAKIPTFLHKCSVPFLLCIYQS